MYTEGMADLVEMIMYLPMCPADQKDAKVALIKDRTKNRYLPAFEKVSEADQFGALSSVDKGKTVTGHL